MFLVIVPSNGRKKPNKFEVLWLFWKIRAAFSQIYFPTFFRQELNQKKIYLERAPRNKLIFDPYVGNQIERLCQKVKTFSFFFEVKNPFLRTICLIFMGKVTVAAHLRSLRPDDPLSKGHPRSIKQQLETLKTFQTYLPTIKLLILSI